LEQQKATALPNRANLVLVIGAACFINFEQLVIGAVAGTIDPLFSLPIRRVDSGNSGPQLKGGAPLS
jgi:hypothetical protein